MLEKNCALDTQCVQGWGGGWDSASSCESFCLPLPTPELLTSGVIPRGQGQRGWGHFPGPSGGLISASWQADTGISSHVSNTCKGGQTALEKNFEKESVRLPLCSNILSRRISMERLRTVMERTESAQLLQQPASFQGSLFSCLCNRSASPPPSILDTSC